MSINPNIWESRLFKFLSSFGCTCYPVESGTGVTLCGCPPGEERHMMQHIVIQHNMDCPMLTDQAKIFAAGSN